MEKRITIGNEERMFRATGATPIKYRKLFKGADFFRDINGMRKLDIENITDAEMESIEKLAYAMCEDSNLGNMTFEKWLEQFDLMALYMAIPEIIGIITGDLETQNISAAKNADRAES